MQTPWLDLDLHRLELRFAAARLVEPRAVERIALDRGRRPDRPLHCSGRGAGDGVAGQRAAGAGGRLSAGRGVAAARARHCTGRVLVVRAERSAARCTGARPASTVRGDRRGAAAARAHTRPRVVTARGRPPLRARRELGEPAPAVDLGATRCGSRGGAHGAAVELGGGACDRAVGARQCRTCETPFAGPRGHPAVHARAAQLVRALPERGPHHAPTPG